MTETAAEHGITLLNAQDLLESKTASGIPGDDWLVDHVHPSFTGNAEIGIEITRWMTDASLLEPENANWKDQARQKCRDRLQSLNDLYFLKGRQRLEILRRWAAGRATELLTDQVR